MILLPSVLLPEMQQQAPHYLLQLFTCFLHLRGTDASECGFPIAEGLVSRMIIGDNPVDNLPDPVHKQVDKVWTSYAGSAPGC